MADQAHEWTDRRLEELTVKLHEVYLQASFEMSDHLEGWMETYESQNRAWKKAVKEGFAKQEDYEAWLTDRLMEKLYQQDMIDVLTYDSINADVKARQLIHDEIPTIYAENGNWSMYDIERQSGLDTAFTLYDQDTVRYLVEGDRKLLPELDQAKDYRWTRQKMTSAIMQSILQGESIPDVMKRLQRVVGISERSSEAVARTAVTYAEAQGRQRSYERAESLGIPLLKEWHAHMDGRTRLAHRQADGQKVRVNERFNVGGNMMTGPGDPTAPGSMIWNCRCRVVGDVQRDDIPPAVIHRYSRLPKGVTYEEWKKGRYRTDRNNVETDESKRERGVE
ncbi:MAG: phage minor head protein [Prevotella sp.]